MIHLDSYTLNIVSLALSAIMAITMYAMYRANKQELCLLDWAGTGLFSALGHAGSILFLSYYTTEVTLIRSLTLGVNNSIYILASLSLLRGILRHLSLKLYTFEMVFISIAVLLMHFFPQINSSLENRTIIFLCLNLAIKGYSIYLLTGAINAKRQWSYLPLLLAEMFVITQFVLRVSTSLLSEAPLFLKDFNNPIQTMGWLSDLLYVSIANLSCLLIIFRKQVLQIRRLAITDQLTGCLNRHAMEDAANVKFKEVKRLDSQFGLLILDIDLFKKINDKYGHDVGDDAIKHIANITKDNLRESDSLFRIGGEEFVVMTITANHSGLITLSEKIRESIEKSILNIDELQLNMTVSIGSAISNEADTTWQDTLKRADQALYKAKDEGRNQSVLAGELLLT